MIKSDLKSNKYQLYITLRLTKRTGTLAELFFSDIELIDSWKTQAYCVDGVISTELVQHYLD